MKSVAIVLNLDANGLGVVRSLGRHSIHVVGVDPNAEAVGFASRYCRTRLVCADPAESAERCIEQLIALCRGFEERPALLPTSDAFVLLLSRHRDLLAQHAHFIIPSAEVVEAIVDKQRQYAWAEQLGIPVPRTISFDERPDEMRDLRFPLFVKGRNGSSWFAAFQCKGFAVQNADELNRRVAQARSRGIEPIAQEIIPGPNRNHYKACAYYSSAHELLALFTTQKTRQCPADFGVGSYMTSMHLPEIAALARQFFEGIRYAGVGSIEFKYDERDGDYKMIELNPRLWQQNSHAAAAGIDFALLNYRDCCGVQSVSQSDFRDDVRWLDAIQDFQSFLANRKTGAVTTMEWIESLLRTDVCAYFAWDDLRPGWKNSAYGAKYFKLPIKLFARR